MQDFVVWWAEENYVAGLDEEAEIKCSAPYSLNLRWHNIYT